MLDREGGRPIKISFEKIDINGFIAKQDSESAKFLAPCVFVVYFDLLENQENGSASSGGAEEVRVNMFRNAQLTDRILHSFHPLFYVAPALFVHINFDRCRS